LRVIGYLRVTKELCPTIQCDINDKSTWYVDESCAIHMGLRRKSGAANCSVKQKNNTRSSTETELIAVDISLPTILWTKSFMLEQAFDLESGIKEDNRSTMLSMKHGRLSLGKRTKHYDNRCFYVKDLFDRGKIAGFLLAKSGNEVFTSLELVLEH
jgi:hypothetical protein